MILAVSEKCFFALGNMEEQSGRENPLPMIPFSFGGRVNHQFYLPEDNPIYQFTGVSGENENSPDALFLSEWIHGQPQAHDYFDFLKESATFLHKAPAEDVIDAVPLSVRRVHSANGVSEIPSEVLYNRLANACGFKSADSSLIMDVWEEKLSPVLSNNHETSTSMGFLRCGRNQETYLNPQNGGGQFNKFSRTEHQICTRDSTLSTQNLNEDKFNVSKHNPRAEIPPPHHHPNPHRSASSRQRAYATDRRRRQRISDRLKALQVLLPHPEEGRKASDLDDVIDYVKYLQLQIKDLTYSRLSGESTSEPFIFLEGYGHYLLHDQMLKEPLEEMMGKLLEVNPSEATQLLENRGLYVMPMSLLEVHSTPRTS